ncbi:MAG: hypothetical protein WCK90_00485 [archaeon]
MITPGQKLLRIVPTAGGSWFNIGGLAYFQDGTGDWRTALRMGMDSKQQTTVSRAVVCYNLETAKARLKNIESSNEFATWEAWREEVQRCKDCVKCLEGTH